MAFERHGQPAMVRRAVLDLDIAALSKWGRSGAAERRRREVRKDVEQSADELRLQRELAELRRSTNEDLIDADGNDVSGEE